MPNYENNYENDGFWISDREIQNVPLHWHAYYEVELCMEGEGIQIINGVEMPITAGCLSLLTPRDFHRIECGEAPLKIKTFCFYEHFISPSVVQAFSDNNAPFRLQLDDREYEEILQAYKRLEQEDRETDSIRRLALKRRIELLCLDIVRKCVAVRAQGGHQVAVEVPEFRDLRAIRSVINYINEHFHEPITREQMAKMLHFSESYFSGVFKKTLGISFSKYLTDCRMDRAMQMIRYSDETIGSIALAVGYNSSSLFYRKFEEYYHTSPSKIERQIDKKNET